jgi:hypothetical protein
MSSDATLPQPARGRRWPAVLIIFGGTLMAVLFLVYTRLHGATSVYEQGRWLSIEGQVWGGLMNGVPSLLIAIGVIGARTPLTAHAGRPVRVGYLLVLIALALPALVDLAIRALSPPLLIPPSRVRAAPGGTRTAT